MFSVIAPIAGYLSYKLRCYTGISSPAISRNNTREKYDIFDVTADTSRAFRTTRLG